MRCAEVTRELAAPSPGADPAALAHHLDTCPRCAQEAETARRFDRVWAQTRPAEPSPAAWERLWAVVAGDAPSTIPLVRPDHRRRWVVPVLSVALAAQAAAMLIAVGILLQRNGIGAAGPVQRVVEVVPVPAQNFRFELDDGQTLILELDGSGGQVVCHPRLVSTDDLVAFDPEEGTPAPDIAFQSTLALLNHFEGME
jgi:hypothetical protein